MPYAQEPRDEDPNVPFLAAIIEGNRKEALHWLNRGAAIDGVAPNEWNRTPAIPLIEAARYQKPHMIDWLLDYGADIKKTDYHGDSALHKAAANGDLNSASILLDRGAAVNAFNGNRSRPLHMATTGGHPDMTKLLLQHGADYQQRDRAGQLPAQLTSNPAVRRILQEAQKPVLATPMLTYEDATPAMEQPDDTAMMAALRYMIGEWRSKNPHDPSPKPEF